MGGAGGSWGHSRQYHLPIPSYAKCEPVPEEQRNHNFWFGEDGHIHVKNLSAYWIPGDVGKIRVLYTVTGSYERTETLSKVERIAKKFAEKMEG